MSDKKTAGCHCPYCDEPLLGDFCKPCSVEIVRCPKCNKPIPQGEEECPECGEPGAETKEDQDAVR